MVIPPAKPDKPNREFGFIHFAEKDTVDKLILGAEQGTKPEMDGKTLEVSSRSALTSLAHQNARCGVPPGVKHLCVQLKLKKRTGSDRLCSCRSRRQSHRSSRTSSQALEEAAAAPLVAAEALAAPEAEEASCPEAGGVAALVGVVAATMTSIRCTCSQACLVCRIALEWCLHNRVDGGPPTVNKAMAISVSTALRL